MRKTILLVGGPEMPAVRHAAERRGYKIVAVNFPEAIERLEPSPSIIHAEGVTFHNPIRAHRRLMELQKEFACQAIVPVSEFGLLAASMAARAVGLPYTSLDAVMNTRDKVRMRRVLQSKGLGQVRFRSCASVEQVAEFFAEIGGPIIVKPLLGTASDGVSRVEREDQIEPAWLLTGAARSFGGVICEEYIEGPEVSVEAYLVDGEFIPVAITDKRTDEHFLEIGHSQPTAFAPLVQDQIFEATRAIVLALGITDGVTHTEMRITPSGPVLIETHSRMGGGSIHLLTLITTGVDLAEITVACALGEKPQARPRRTGQAAAIRFATGPAGIVKAVALPEPGTGGILEVRSYVVPGDETTGRSSSIDRLGHVIVTGSNRAEAEARAEAALAGFHIELAPLTPPRAQETVTGKTVLFVGGANLPAVREAAERRGLEIIAVNYAEAIEQLEPAPSVIHVEALDFRNVLQAQRRMIELHRQFQFQGIVAVSEYGLQAASMAGRALGLPHTSMEAVANTRDKVRMRRKLEAQGLGQVRFRSCTSVAQVGEFLATIGGPIIVKPHLGTGSDGVSRVDRPDQVEAAWSTAGAARSFGGVLCEEFIDGPEVSIEAYLVDGAFFPVAITDKMTDSRFLEIGHSQPSAVSPEVQAQIFDATRKVLVALGITHGVTHTEMRLSTRGPMLIETHTRMGGDFISTLTRITTGVDLSDVLVACALDEKPSARPRETGTAAAIRFLTGPAGVVSAIDLPTVDAGNGIIESRAYVKVGDQTTGRSASVDRFGHVLTTGATRAEADQRAEAALARFHVTLQEVPCVAIAS